MRDATPEILFITAIFGEKFKRLYPAFKNKNYRCVCFTNNPQLQKEAKRKGWEFVLIDKFPLSNDYKESSLQSKYIKFLQFLNDYPEFRVYDNITYFDHKNVFSASEAERLKQLFEPDKNIFMLSSREGWNIRDEFHLSTQEERYGSSKSITEQWIQKQVDAGRATWDGQIYATSYIAYKNYAPILPFLKELYDVLWELRQPQCQTIWGVLSQEQKSKIQSIHWIETSMYRRTPLPFFQELRRTGRHSLRKMIKPLFQLLGIDYEKFRKDYLLKILSRSPK